MTDTKLMPDEYPTAHEEEKLLLSCIMRAGGAVRKQAVDRMRPEMFDRYQALASVVLDLARETRPDPDTVRAAFSGPEEDLKQVLSVRPAPRQAPRLMKAVQEAFGKLSLIDTLHTRGTRSQSTRLKCRRSPYIVGSFRWSRALTYGRRRFLTGR